MRLNLRRDGGHIQPLETPDPSTGLVQLIHTGRIPAGAFRDIGFRRDILVGGLEQGVLGIVTGQPGRGSPEN